MSEKSIGVKIATSELIGFLNSIEERDAPKYLYIEGDKEIINYGPKVSIIGTRKPSLQGIKNTKDITKELVKNKVVIVSGLAKGVDTEAHKTAIEFGGKTIAVLGTPLDKYYPPQNKELQDKIMNDYLAISQFPLGAPINRSNFPLRNRTMALISDASIIIEAGGENSGTRHQGWEALRLGRPLYIHEDLIKSGLKWPKAMLKYGAEIISNKGLLYIFQSLPTKKQEMVELDVKI